MTHNWGSDNPAPYIFENDTVLMLARKSNHSAAVSSTIWLIRAPSYRGPYEHVHDRPILQVNHSIEDPNLWRDTRGHFHAFFHHNGPGGHAWSVDGISWSWNDGARPWSSTLALPNGTVVAIADNERPRVWINRSTGQPELLFVASGGDRQPTRPGDPPSFTLVQRIRTAKPV